MAGTTVTDDGLVEAAFTRAVAGQGEDPEPMLPYIRKTMGESKITVFRALFPGDECRAQQVNSAFEKACTELIAEGRCAPLPGAAEAIAMLRDRGLKTVFTTGFSRTTQRAVLDALGWDDLVDLALCPADAGRGRPYPDLVFTALTRLGLDDVRSVAAAGDTSADMLTARRAGARIAAGVLTGAHDEAALRRAGATHVLASVAELPALVADH
ncbi:phosphonatase-like hydrolase [Streptomyces pathocidini]|uniref:Phosphonatase-like hydrolase n=1 Tax=Streptomyces pathocidini TaxID=1650571 RepID=A0ABW7UWP7_9ACTN